LLDGWGRSPDVAEEPGLLPRPCDIEDKLASLDNDNGYGNGYNNGYNGNGNGYDYNNDNGYANGNGNGNGFMPESIRRH
jgi:hypothetical protein